jgi:autotransporter-associated beta strand protein
MLSSIRAYLALGLLISSTLHAVDIDTTGGATITGPINFGANDTVSNITGAGTLTLNGSGVIGLANNGGGKTVNMNMTGGLIDIGTGVRLQNGGWSSGNWTNNLASVNIAAGGTLDVWDGTAVRVDALTGAGLVDITRGIGIENFGAGWAGTRTFIVGVNNGGGTFTGAIAGSTALGDGGNLDFTKNGTGTQIITGTNTYAGITTINNGTLQIGNGGSTGTIGSGNITNNAALAFNRSGTSTVAGIISGTGSLTTSGTGTFILANNNSYAGATTINTGSTLQIGNGGGTGSLGTASTVANDGTLAYNLNGYRTQDKVISGSGGVSYAGGATYEPTVNHSYAGPTTINSSQVMAPGDARLGTAPAAPTVSIIMSGGSIFNGNFATTLNANRTIQLNAGGGQFRAGYGQPFTINGKITGTGSLSLNWDGSPLVLTNATNDYAGNTVIGIVGAGAYTPGSATLRMGVANALPFGAGKGNLVFNTNADTPAATSILELNGFSTQVNGLIGTAAGRITSGTAATLTFGNNDQSSTFAGIVSGSAALAKVGTGTQILSGNNTHGGGTTITAGTLQIGDGGAAGSLGNGATVNNAALIINRTGSFTIGSAVTGTGTVTIEEGTVQLSVGGPGGTFAGSGAIVINSGGTLQANQTDALGYNNYSATNTITINEGGTLTTVGPHRYSNDRTINCIGGTVGATGTGFNSNASYTMRSWNGASYNFTSAPSGTPSTISAVDFGLQGNVILNVTDGPGAVDLNVTGNIVDVFGSGQLVKSGTGTMVLNAASTYTGTTAVNAGTLIVRNTTGSATGTGSVTVAVGAKLAGTGRIAGAVNNSITVSGTLTVGDPTLTTAVSSVLELTTSGTGSTVLAAGSVVELDVFTNAGNNSAIVTAIDSLKVTGLVSSAGTTLKLTNPNGITNWALGDQWKLIDVTGGTLSGSFTVDATALNLGPALTGRLDRTTGMFSIVSSTPPPSYANLLGYWNFDGDSYADASGKERDAQAGPGAQAPLFSTDVARPFAGRSNSKSLDLRDRTVPSTGTNCYAFVPGSGSLFNPHNASTNPSSSFTVSLWVKGWPVDAWVPFISKNGEPNGWQIRRNGAGNEIDWTTRGSATGFFNGNGDHNSGATAVTAPGLRNTQWFHYTCTFDGTTKRIFVNSQLVAQEVNANATIQNSTNLLVFGARDNGGINSFSRVMLDEIAIWDRALTQVQVSDLTTGTDPRYIHSQITPWNLGEPWGTTGNWGIKEAQTSNPLWTVSTLNNVIGILATHPGVTGSSPTIFFKDPENAGGGGAAPANFLTHTAGVDDNNIGQIANCCFRVTTAGDYTFVFNGDDGFQASLFGVNWTKINLHNGNASISGETVTNMVPTGDTNTYVVANLPVGDYNFRYLFNEVGGGAYNRVRYAPGDKSGDDGSLKLLGDPTGTLQLVDQAPMLMGFTSSHYVIVTNPSINPATINIAWDTKYTNNLSITPTLPGNPTITPGGGWVSIPSPTTTTTYTLTGTNGTQTRTRNFTVFVNVAPIISSFALTDSTLTPGAPMTLNWNTIGATNVSIDNGVGTVTPTASGSITFAAPASTTTYTLTATNAVGTVTATATVTIGAAPVIQSFTAVDTAIMPEGSAELSWNVTGADTRVITPRPGAVAATGTLLERINQPTTYQLTATNSFGSVSQSIAITMPTPLYLTSAGWSYTRVSATAPTVVNSLSIADQLFAGTLAGTSFGPVTGLTQINMGDGAVGALVGGEIIPLGGNGDHFTVKCTATIIVNFPGLYTFGINNDDGGRLRIDGQDVIVDDTNHAPLTTTGTARLTAGAHTIEYVFFEAVGGFAGEAFFFDPNGNFSMLAASSSTPPLAVTTTDLVINEFMASNTDGIVDADGSTSDWIELYNGTASPISLAGCYLTNDAALPAKWAFPTTSAYVVQPGEHFLVFASGKNIEKPGNEYHTNFTLASSGGYVGLRKDNGSGGYTLLSEFTYGPQSANRSFGKYDTEQYTGFFITPTPRSVNVAGYEGIITDTSFDVNRGVKTAPFNLTLTASEPTATIRYTIDGSTPSETNGLTYTAPLNISATTVVRAAAFKPHWYPTNVDTHTYVFTADVPAQSAAFTLAKGFPLGPVAGQRLDYGMDGRVASPANAAALQTALNAIPSVSITTDMANLMSPQSGIYVSAVNRGENWERPASFEILNDSPTSDNSTGTVQKQIDCGLRMRGGYSRDDNNPKHAFRLFFSNQYDGDFNYSIFGPEGAKSFENLDLQCPQNYSWSFSPDTGPGAAYQGNTFLRELFARDTQREMGQPHTRTRHYHLYINGIYWGLYASQERAENAYGSSYLGGQEESYDVVKTGPSTGYTTEATDGSMAQGTSTAPGSAWSRLWYGARELRTVATTEAERNARYFALQGLDSNGLTPLAPATAPRVLNPENLADYVLTTFYCGSFDAPLSTFLNNASNNWYGMRNRDLNNGFVFFCHDFEHGMGSDQDGRSTDRVGPWGGAGTNFKGVAQYNTAGDYLRSNPQYLNEDLAFSKEYRMKFADRVHRAFFNNGALSPARTTARINARANVLQPAIIAESARWGDAQNANPFTTNDWLSAKTRLFNWINAGSTQNMASNTQAGRINVVLAQLRAYKDKPTGTSTGAGDTSLLSMPLYPLIDAPVLSQHGGVTASGAIVVTNPNTTGDIGSIKYRLDDQDPRLPGGAERSGTLTIASGGTVTLPSSARITARIYQSSTQEWSALTDANFVVGVPASSSNLVISEINYNPNGGTPGTATDRQLYEFLELWNPTNDIVQLEGVAFSFGITFDFATSPITQVPANGRILIVRDAAAFASRYPDSLYPGLSAKIAGTFQASTALDNGGERLAITNSVTGLEITNFIYDDEPTTGWPTSPDGNGRTLCLTNTSPTTANKNLAVSWFGHGLPRGNPGGPDAASYLYGAYSTGLPTPGPTGDNDGDGVQNLMEYALMTLSDNSNSVQLPVGTTQSLVVGAAPAQTYLTLTFNRSLIATDITYRVQTSSDMATWTDDAVLVQSVIIAPGISDTVTYRCPAPVPGDDRHFIRLLVQQNP